MFTHSQGRLPFLHTEELRTVRIPDTECPYGVPVTAKTGRLRRSTVNHVQTLQKSKNRLVLWQAGKESQQSDSREDEGAEWRAPGGFWTLIILVLSLLVSDWGWYNIPTVVFFAFNTRTTRPMQIPHWVGFDLIMKFTSMPVLPMYIASCEES